MGSPRVRGVWAHPNAGAGERLRLHPAVAGAIVAARRAQPAVLARSCGMAKPVKTGARVTGLERAAAGGRGIGEGDAVDGRVVRGLGPLRERGRARERKHAGEEGQRLESHRGRT